MVKICNSALTYQIKLPLQPISHCLNFVMNITLTETIAYISS